MIGSIAATLVAVWFYYSAQRADKQPVSWAVAGVLVYFLVALVWSALVTPDIKDNAQHTQSGLMIFLVRYAYIIAGVAAAIAFNLLAGKNNNPS